MKKLITTATLLAAGTALASAAWTAGTTMQDTDKIDYEYVQESETKYLDSSSIYSGKGSTGSSNEVKIDVGGTVDFRRDARYHITFEMVHYGHDSGDYPASGILTMVNSNNDVSLLFGNGRDTMARFGCILGSDVNATNGLENFVANSAGTNVWTAFTNGTMGYGNGSYQYHLIFETFSDSSINDKIYFGVTNEATGKYVYSLLLNSSHLGCGAHTEQVFDDIGFNLVGTDSSSTSTAGNPSVELVGKKQSTTQSKMTVWSRTETVIPEPSAFGLLAGVGAIALAASRRRRSRA